MIKPPDHGPDTPGAGWRGLLRGRCQICQQWHGAAICSDCLARFLPSTPRCRRCALALAAQRSAAAETAISADARVDLCADICTTCQALPPLFESAVALADYGFPWDRLVARLKFQQHPELAGLLGRLMAGAVARSGHRAAQLVVPVPLTPTRLAERGYNQAWQLARSLAATLRLPTRADVLERWLDAPHQVGANRQQRQDNLRDAIWVDPQQRRHLRGRHVALVDDVLTTGVTAHAASAALLAAGAASVQVWVLTRTPAPEFDI